MRSGASPTRKRSPVVSSIGVFSNPPARGATKCTRSSCCMPKRCCMPRLTEREIELLLAQHYVTVCASIAAQRTASAPQDVAADIPHILKAQHAMHDRASNDPDAAQACWQFAHATGTAALGLVDVVDLIRWNTQGRAAAKHLPVDRRMRVDFQLAANLGYLYARTGDLQRAAEHYN